MLHLRNLPTMYMQPGIIEKCKKIKEDEAQS